MKMILIIAIVAFLFIPARAQFNAAGWDTLTTDTLYDALSHQSLATVWDDLHLTYAKLRAPGAGWDVHYRHFGLGSGWGEDRVVEFAYPCFGPVIAARWAANQPMMAILFWANDDICCTIFTDPEEPFEVINISHSTDQDNSPTVAIDDAGQVHSAWITYVNGQYKIAYSLVTSDTPQVEIIWDTELGEFGGGAQPFMVTTGAQPYIFYRGVANGYRIQRAYHDWPETTWTIETLYTPNSEDYSASAAVDGGDNIHLAISGNDGWGMPAHIYYTRWDIMSDSWSAPVLASGGYSAVGGSLALHGNDTAYIASCGVSGNIYNGRVYISNGDSLSFSTELLATFSSVSQPALAMISNVYGALVLDSPVGGDRTRDYEILYYGPEAGEQVDDPLLPADAALLHAYPNPFNPAINISYALDKPANVKLSIFNLLGQKVAILADGMQPAGSYSFSWNAALETSGIYFAHLTAGNRSERVKLLLLK